MNNRLTTHQVCLLLFVSITASKFQRLPSLMSEYYSRSIWLVALVFMLMEVLITCFILFLLSRFKGATLFEFLSSKLGKGIMCIVAFLLSVYFYFKIGASYKGVHEFFANTLFDKLSWSYFSIIFLLLLIFLSTTGLNVIGRSSELYGLIIGVSIAIAMILGLKSCVFERLLPVFETINKNILVTSIKFVPWFSNYMILFLFVGNVEFNKKCCKNVFWTYLASGVLVVLVYVLFIAINGNLSVYQSNTLSSITQNSLIGLGIGRPDWFLVLITMIGNFLSSALYLFGIVFCFSKAFNIKFNYFLVLLGAILLYISDIYLLPNLDVSQTVLCDYGSYFMASMNIILPLLCLLAIIIKNKDSKSGYRARCQI